MSDQRIVSLRNPWFTTSVGIVVLLAIAAALVGFIWLPALQGHVRAYGLWNTICSAAGLIRPAASEPVVEPTYPITEIAITSQRLRGANAGAIGRGATLALRCAMCHGARGLSQANTPNLAGQYGVAIYKELQDFKSGARTSAVMAPLVADLSDQDMRDLAAYYAYLPRVSSYHRAGISMPQIVLSGAPMRNIAPCGACHGELTNKAGSPWLEGQPADYLKAQLLAFAAGARHNDISEQMRNVARQMTRAEIAAAVRYYGSKP
jgi:cytochrome c553